MKKFISFILCALVFATLFSLSAFATANQPVALVVNSGENVTIDGTEGYVSILVLQGGTLNVKPDAKIKADSLHSFGTLNIGENAHLDIPTCAISGGANFEKRSTLDAYASLSFMGSEPVVISGRISGVSSVPSIYSIDVTDTGCLHLFVNSDDLLRQYESFCFARELDVKKDGFNMRIRSKNHKHICNPETQICIACKESCPHSEYDKTTHTCLACNTPCPHKTWKNGVCVSCSFVCSHEKDVCAVCGCDRTSKKTASVFSGGNLAIITALLGALIGFLIATLIFKKKKKSDDVIKTDDEN